MVALMTEALYLEPDHNVLEIGTGSGYQTAILARLVRHVDTIERIPELAQAARKVLADLDISNVTVHVGDGTRGLEQASPFHGILVTAGSPGIPGPLVEQLEVGGRLVIPVGDAAHQTLTTVVREPQGIRKEGGTGCVFVPLIGAFGWEEREPISEHHFNEPEP